MWWANERIPLFGAAWHWRIRFATFRVFLGIGALAVLALTGCVSVPPANRVVSGGPSEEQLTSHVQFLAQAALKGRKPRSRGSALAREYIADRFAAWGLVPWGAERRYELSFGYGKNVVGLLPGSDPNLASEIVLVSAHYDHLGKHEGKINPGAADNASGVAAVLEVARTLSAQRPRRTVAFAAFDCEEQMLLGSFAFTCREDVRDAKIVSVVNLDMLGRSFLDSVTNTLFVTGTEKYPGIREQVTNSARATKLRVLPIGSDLIGPRSDHVAFQARDVPCLFISCGTFPDYHKPGDTAERINYDELQRSTELILETTRALANTKEVPTPIGPGYDMEEVRTLTTLLPEIIDHLDETISRKEEGPASPQPKNGAANLDSVIKPIRSVIMSLERAELKRMERAAQEILNTGQYDWKSREALAIEAAGTLAPYLGDVGGNLDKEGNDDSVAFMKYLQLFYLNYGREMMEGYRELVTQLLKYRPNPFRGMPRFEREVYDIPDIQLREVRPGVFALNTLGTHFSLSAECRSSRWFIKSFSGEFSASVAGVDCEGTRQQIADYCLLLLRREQTNDVRSTALRKVYRTVTGKDGIYAQLLKERLAEGGFDNETEWILACVSSDSPDLALEAVGAAEIAAPSHEEQIRRAACRILLDRPIRADLRVSALGLAGKHGAKDRLTLLALCDVLDDDSPASEPESLPRFREDYPFAERQSVKISKTVIEQQMKRSPNASKSIGDLARDELKKSTGEDFGKDAEQWREWIRRN